jgi:hypothetical protein
MSRVSGVKKSTVSQALKYKSKFQKKYYLISKEEFSDELLNYVVHKQPKKHKGTRIHQYNKNGVFITTWDAIKHASDALGIDYSSIWHCCEEKYNINSAGGFIWSYAD